MQQKLQWDVLEVHAPVDVPVDVMHHANSIVTSHAKAYVRTTALPHAKPYVEMPAMQETTSKF